MAASSAGLAHSGSVTGQASADVISGEGLGGGAGVSGAVDVGWGMTAVELQAASRMSDRLKATRRKIRDVCMGTSPFRRDAAVGKFNIPTPLRPPGFHYSSTHRSQYAKFVTR